MSDDLVYMPATEALARFKDKSLSPVELMNALISRGDTVEPKINAFTDRYTEEALQQARRAEAKYAKGARTRALEGLPVAVKDESAIKGKVTTEGVLYLKDRVHTATSWHLERLQRAGAIFHARTATPEYCCAGSCFTALHGVTRNPWHLDYTPGGSSGGSGAALAAGTAPLATGSDIAGSIRIPAAASGVVGLKASYGRIPQEPPFNLDTYCHVGPMARTVGDVAAMFNVMCGPHPEDHASLRPKIRVPEAASSVKGLRIALSEDLGYFTVDADVKAGLHRVADALRDQGATVEPVEVPWGRWVTTAAFNHLEHIFGAILGGEMIEHRHELMDYTIAFGERGLASTPHHFVASLYGAGRAYAALGPILEQYDALICPTLAQASVSATFNHWTDTLEIDGQEVDGWHWLMTFPFNVLSRCPVLAMPSGRDRNGLVTSVQVVGKTYDDPMVVRVGYAVEAGIPMYRDAASRPAL